MWGVFPGKGEKEVNEQNRKEHISLGKNCMWEKAEFHYDHRIESRVFHF